MKGSPPVQGNRRASRSPRSLTQVRSRAGGLIGFASGAAVGLFLLNLPLSTAGAEPHSHTHAARPMDHEKRGTSSNPLPAHAYESHVFANLPEMVATSDAVVEATVIDVQPGTLYEEEPGQIEGSVQFSNVVMRVDAVNFVRGALPISSGDRLVNVELVRESGLAIEINEVDASIIGDRGFYFIALLGSKIVNQEAMLSFGLTSSQGRYLIQTDGTLRGSNPHDPLVQSIQSLTPEQLRQQIEHAREGFLSGQVQPQPPLIPCPEQGCAGTDAPALEVTVKAERHRVAFGWGEGQEIYWSCDALAINALAEKTRIISCRIRDLDYWDESVWDDRSAESDSNLAIAKGSLFDAGKDSYQNVEICWEASASFKGDENGISTDEGCTKLTLD